MRTTTTEKLAELQGNPGNVRNICILAHVDHGKTTLADALVASNGIISQRMAGKLRYLDSREDEQIRGITMKSSAISLHFHNDTGEFLVNLIDSPGHVDFSSEVSTAVRLCDGAIVVVDVVEGVCPQTHAVLRQAWLENIRPILVLNKLDRLITELEMEPLQAFIHLQQILEQVNVVTSELFTADVMSLYSSDPTQTEGGTQQTHDWHEEADEQEHKNIYFSPDLGNVVFASAYDGWGFTIDQFADIYGKKLGMNVEGLQKTLWGDFFLNSKTKRIMKGAQLKGKKPLFVQFVLESIWSVYEAVLIRRDMEMTKKIQASLGLKMNVRDTRQNDTRVLLQAMMGQWLPISSAVLGKVVEKLPSPLEIAEEKIEKLMCNQARRFDSLPPQTQALKQDFLACSSSEEKPTIIFVSKMVPVDKTALPQNKQRPLTEAELERRREAARQRHAVRMEQRQAAEEGGAETQGKENGQADGQAVADWPANKPGVAEDLEGQVFVGFARVYSGRVRKGQKLYVLGPKHDPARALQKLTEARDLDATATVSDLSSDDHVTVATVTDLYMFMGRELEALESVPAGNVLGIAGLEDHILKSGTVSSTVACTAFTDLYFDASPILRVALEPTHPGEMGKLVSGLRLLNQADPCVQVLVQETGEHVIVTAGEVHLQKCLDDLQQRYAKIEITASSPIVPFRETIVPPPTMDMVNESIITQNSGNGNVIRKEFEDDEEVLERGLVRIYTPNKSCMVQIRALPLPPEVTDYLDENQLLIKTLDQYVSSKISDRHKADIQVGSKLKQSTKEAMKEFKEKLEKLFTEAGKQWKDFVEHIWAFGPKRVGPNILVNRVEEYDRLSIWDCLSNEKQKGKVFVRDYEYSVMSGFQLATLTGPLCDEPMRGVCFVMEKWEVAGNQPKMEKNTERIDKNERNSEICGENLEIKLSKVSLDTNSIESKSKETLSECNGSSKDSDTKSHENGLTNRSVSITSDKDETEEELVPSSKGQGQNLVQGHMSGQLISIVKEACLKSFQTQPQRLMAAMYKCNTQASTEVLGKLFAVIGKRHGRILQDEMREGSQMFNILASIPVVESFGFAEEIRKRTSGFASPQLVFSHWEVIDLDPFWVPTTEEEIMHYGEKADSENRARVYMNNVRERKGLKVDKKIVEHAEKQRTLTRNK
ncbi:elongation factor-like GTPase 1 [Mya arenaria]|uniref:elongation factor-like GTPase 1 n=1 Tax=Mya arenaria TaxID=6604 RepID=UPI0022E57772|nr:elongation factor-like GTPase 1 [Mya arenaria]